MNKYSTLNGHEIDQHIATNLLKVAPSPEHAEEFLAAAVRLCELQRQEAYWNHTVCHFIEKYSEGNHRSLLHYIEDPAAAELPQYRAAFEMLVEKAFPDTNCLERILEPLVQFNLAANRRDPGNQSFACLPASLRKPENLEVARGFFVKGKYFDLRSVTLMMESTGPQDLWRRAVEQSVPLLSYYDLPKHIESPIPREKLMGYLEACFSREELARVTGGLSLGEAIENCSTKIGDEMHPGLYVDVDGTLLFTDKEGKDALNTTLHTTLLQALAAGISITVFSGGSPTTQSQRLQDAGASQELLDVKSKAEYKGRLLEVIIDDTRPVLGGFGAGTWFSPGASALKAHIEEMAKPHHQGKALNQQPPR